MHLILLGAPGSGKGTQAELLAKRLGYTHLATGDLFREAVRGGSELGRLAQSYMERGALVPDEVTIGLVRERLERANPTAQIVFDGYPRKWVQARALDELLASRGEKIDAVILLNVSTPILVERLSGRWVCRAQGHNYHLAFHPPRVAGVCDVDGAELYQRDDDRPEVVQRRIAVFLREIVPLIAYYGAQGVLHEIDGAQEIEAVHRQILSVGGIPKAGSPPRPA
ncbi:MAG: adenylate kinase [Chloroflexi bacterium]|nr:adenylate kinase [Chloroflexota bacterium]